MLDQAHRVVAHVADHAGGDRRQLGRQVDARLGQERAQRFEGRQLLGLEGVRMALRLAVDLGLVTEGAPDNVGVDADDGIAAAHRTALDRFQQAAHGAPVGQLEHGRDGRLEIGDQARPYHLRSAGRVVLGEHAGGGLGLEVPAEILGAHVELGHRSIPLGRS